MHLVGEMRNFLETGQIFKRGMANIQMLNDIWFVWYRVWYTRELWRFTNSSLTMKTRLKSNIPNKFYTSSINSKLYILHIIFHHINIFLSFIWRVFLPSPRSIFSYWRRNFNVENIENIINFLFFCEFLTFLLFN